MPDGLRIRGLSIRRGEAPLLALDAHVAPGAVLTVMGPSGSGKSTLLSWLTGTLAPGFAARGTVTLNGREITALPAHRRRIGLLFQDDLLFPHMSVAQNLAYGLRPGGSRGARRMRIAEALEQVGLPGFGDRDPATLSGGQRARVALMRMLLAEPEAVLLDEPFSGLDTDLRDRTRAMVFARARERDLPMILVTHDAADAEAAGGAVLRLG